MQAEPIAIGAVLLVIGIILQLLEEAFADLVEVGIAGWGWLLILVGLVIIAARLIWMFKGGRTPY